MSDFAGEVEAHKPEDLDSPEVMVLDEISDPELALPIWEATGNPDVDGALELIQTLDSENVHSHVDILKEVHSQLHAHMANIDR
jgi:hypothetical protein